MPVSPMMRTGWGQRRATNSATLPSMSRSKPVRPCVRSATIEVPTGLEFQVLVKQRGGWAIEGATVKLLALDSVQLREYEGVADWGGKCTLTNVLPGSYQLDVRADRFGTVTRRVRIKADTPPEPLDVLMSLRR